MSRSATRSGPRAIVRGAALAAAALFAGSCAFRTYDSYRIEFDSATGFASAVGGEPASLELDAEVLRWPWPIRNLWMGWGLDLLLEATMGVGPSIDEVDDPNLLLRDALQAMADRAVGDLSRTADLGLRALWLLAQKDAAPIDRIYASWVVTRLAEGLDVDPLVARQVPTDAAAAADREAAARAVLAELDPARRRDAALDPADRARWLAAVADLARHPSPRRIEGRDAIRALQRAVRTAPDAAAAEVARYALADRLGDEFARELGDEVRNAPEPELRRTALRSLLRLAGPAAMPYVLAIARSPDVRLPDRYDPDGGVRLAWVRICSALPRTLAFARYADGPRPIDFLYDMTQQADDPGLARVARDALARLVGRPASDDPAWPARWWADEVVRSRSER